MSAGHVSTWTEDEDGWPVIVCSCGWTAQSMPDAETAADAWGDHMYVVGFKDGQYAEARFA